MDEKTAGVIPYEFNSRRFGRITLYDFAGQREFYRSHAALLCNAIQFSPPIFLLVVNISGVPRILIKRGLKWSRVAREKIFKVPHPLVCHAHYKSGSVGGAMCLLGHRLPCWPALARLMPSQAVLSELQASLLIVSK